MILMCHHRGEPLGQSNITWYQGVSKMTQIVCKAEEVLSPPSGVSMEAGELS